MKRFFFGKSPDIKKADVSFLYMLTEALKVSKNYKAEI